jgi:NAD(P)-dependent dehydrogenase (short-subunit alcohol dehydrogenase family)
MAAAAKVAIVTGAGTGIGSPPRLRCCAKATADVLFNNAGTGAPGVPL